MSISFVRIDDRVIHGQLVTRWAKELPCDGIVAIDDAVAADPLLSSVMKGTVQDTKVWLFDTATAIEKLPKVIASEKRYFVIGKSPVTLKRIEEAGISRSALFKKIKTLIGISPMELIKNIRLKKAAELIEEGSDNFTQVAYKVGFKDSQHFSKCFKQIYGVTPTEYRKKHLG